MPAYPLAEWKTEQLRLTVFPAPGSAERTVNWWEQIVGDAPEESLSSPRKSSVTTSGSFGESKLILKLEAGRIDWLMTAPDLEPEALVNVTEHPTIGPLTESMERFGVVVKKWFEHPDLPRINRIAFGAVLLHPEPSKESGYVKLADYIPVKIAPGSSDFLYQINYPVPSETGIDSLIVNRLTKWSVGVFRQFSFTTTTGITHKEPVFSLRCELDINTAPTLTGPIPPAKLLKVFDELARWGKEIAEKGTLTI